MKMLGRSGLALCLIFSLLQPAAHAAPEKRKGGCAQYSIRFAMILMAIGGVGFSFIHYYKKEQEKIAREAAHQAAIKAGGDVIMGDYQYGAHTFVKKGFGSFKSEKELEAKLGLIAKNLAHSDPTPLTVKGYFKALEQLAKQDASIADRFQKAKLDIAALEKSPEPARIQLERALFELGKHEAEQFNAGNRPQDYSFGAFASEISEHAQFYRDIQVSEKTKANWFGEVSSGETNPADDDWLGPYLRNRLAKAGKEPEETLKAMERKMWGEFEEQRQRQNPAAAPRTYTWTEQDQQCLDSLLKNHGDPKWNPEVSWEDGPGSANIGLRSNLQWWIKLRAEKGIRYKNLDEAFEDLLAE